MCWITWTRVENHGLKPRTDVVRIGNGVRGSFSRRIRALALGARASASSCFPPLARQVRRIKATPRQSVDKTHSHTINVDIAVANTSKKAFLSCPDPSEARDDGRPLPLQPVYRFQVVSPLLNGYSCSCQGKKWIDIRVALKWKCKCDKEVSRWGFKMVFSYPFRSGILQL